MFTHFKQHSSAIVQYLFDIFTRHGKLQSKALDTLLEFSCYCKEQFTSEVTASIHGFLTQHYTYLSLSHAQKLIEALSVVTSVIDKANFGTNL